MWNDSPRAQKTAPRAAARAAPSKVPWTRIVLTGSGGLALLLGLKAAFFSTSGAEVAILVLAALVFCGILGVGYLRNRPIR